MAEIGQNTIIRLSDRDIVAIDYKPAKPQIVYHYTNIEVLKIILSSQKLRLTNLRMFSDKSEYMHGLNLLIKGISDYECRLGIESRYQIPREFYDKVFFPNDLYAICFTENGDDYNFWNSKYVGTSQPIAIGFLFNDLRSDNIILNRCDYGDSLPSKVDSVVYKLVRDIYTRNYTDDEKYQFIHLAYKLAHFKKKAFSSENEWRFTIPATPRSQEPKSKHIHVNINLNSIAEIVIGGGENIPRNHKLVEGIVQQYRITPKIIDSSVPFYPNPTNND